MPLYQRDNIPLERFVQLIPDLVYIQEFPSQRIIFINRKFTHILGYDKQDLIENDFRLDFAILKSDMVFSEEKMQELLRMAETEQTLAFNVQVKHQKGHTVLLRHRSLVLKSSNPEALFEMLCIAEDITTLQQTNELIHQQRNQLYEAEKIFKFGSWEWVMGDDLVTWSDGLLAVFGYDKGALPTNRLSYGFYQQHIPAYDLNKAIHYSLEAVTQKKSYYTFEHAIVDAKGVKKQLAVRGKCFLDDAGNVVKVIGTSADITQLKQYEIELEQKIEELSKSNKNLEQFAYIASHDLQEPLRKITAFGERLAEQLKQETGDESAFYIERILDASQRMRKLIDTILAYSRVTRSIETFEPVNLQPLLGDVLEDLEIKIQQSQASIHLDALPTIAGMPVQLHQLFQNLLSNALKFRKEGIQPCIRITATPVAIEELLNLKLPLDKPFWKITIEDNGIGFEAEYQEKIFVMFQRLHGQSVFEGSGLGLAICQKIAENHQGIIVAKGQPNEGASFMVYLPAVQ